MQLVDLRSDTVTKPTMEMLEAMASAEVGDDVYGEDPTVNRLQEMAAEAMGKEAGLFVASGTMGNLAALLAHCSRGDEVLVGNKNHIFLFEAGGMSALGGIHSHQLTSQRDGSVLIEHVEAAIRPDDAHDPITRLVCLENSHNRCGGTVQQAAYIIQLAELAHSRGLGVHLDGARIFNAAARLGVSAAELAVGADSVTFCLSKGLCAPVGSVLCGSRQFITRAHRARKMLGGGMRQAGVLAAAGIVALEKMVSRLHQDHERARRLAEGLRSNEMLELDTDLPPTNMVFLGLRAVVILDADEVAARLRAHRILVSPVGPRHFRLVTHHGVDDEGVHRTISAFAAVLGS